MFAILSIRKLGFQTSNCQDFDQQIGAKSDQKTSLNKNLNFTTKIIPKSLKIWFQTPRVLPAAHMSPQVSPRCHKRPQGAKVQAPGLPNDKFCTPKIARSMSKVIATNTNAMKTNLQKPTCLCTFHRETKKKLKTHKPVNPARWPSYDTTTTTQPSSRESGQAAEGVALKIFAEPPKVEQGVIRPTHYYLQNLLS